MLCLCPVSIFDAGLDREAEHHDRRVDFSKGHVVDMCYAQRSPCKQYYGVNV